MDDELELWNRRGGRDGTTHVQEAVDRIKYPEQWAGGRLLNMWLMADPVSEGC